ncbi:hypothetical protein C0J52_08474 [Blattella germanica]|nr:hypothetical protein C0J52_08474 [Blattella germanica]
MRKSKTVRKSSAEKCFYSYPMKVLHGRTLTSKIRYVLTTLQYICIKKYLFNSNHATCS